MGRISENLESRDESFAIFLFTNAWKESVSRDRSAQYISSRNRIVAASVDIPISFIRVISLALSRVDRLHVVVTSFGAS